MIQNISQMGAQNKGTRKILDVNSKNIGNNGKHYLALEHNVGIFVSRICVVYLS